MVRSEKGASERLSGGSGKRKPELRSREERVAQLREQVKNGTYKVDPQKVSKAIISKHLDE